MKFDFKHSLIYPAMKYESCFKLANIFRKIFLIFLFVTGAVFFYGFLGNWKVESLKIALSLFIFEIIIFIISFIFSVFFKEKLLRPETKISLKEFTERPERFNLVDFLDFNVAKSLYKAVKFSRKKGYLLTSSIFLFFILKGKSGAVNFFLQRALISKKELWEKLSHSFIKKEKPEDFCSNDLEKALLDSFENAKKFGHQKVKISDVIISLSQNNPILKNEVVKSNLKLEDVDDLVDWWNKIEKFLEKKSKKFDWANLSRKGSIGRNFSAGYTITLDRYGIDWTELSGNWAEDAIAGHKDEFKILERALANTRINNALLIGEPGSGRKTIIKRLVIRAREGRTMPELNYKRFVELNLSSLLSKINSLEDVEYTLDKIFSEVAISKNTILIIDEIHNYLSGVQRPSVVDISGIISKYLYLPHFQLIGITTYEGLHLYLEKNPSVLSLFRKVEVPPLTAKDSLTVIENLVPYLEKKYKIFFSFASLESIIDYSNQYITGTPFPKRAVDLLDEVAVYVAKESKSKIVFSDHVAQVVTEKTQIPVGGIRGKERKILLNLEKLIHKRIINQEEAVSNISSALRRAREQVSIRKGPMGSFLFLGPTGVGKTETAKALTAIYFGSESRIVRLDMSEFQNLKDIDRIIGSEKEEGLLTTRVKEDPFSLVLLDEFEKAHPKILNLFLQVFDEGYLTDGLGRKIDFKNTIIIATSNAGYKVILDAIEKNIPMAEIKRKLMNYLYENAIFRPELVNRFDGVIVFKSLTKQNLLDIAELLMRKLEDSLKEKEIEFVITTELKEEIVRLSYNPIYGAREMRRVIQDKVGDAIAKALLSGEIQKGDKIKIDPKTFKVIKISQTI